MADEFGNRDLIVNEDCPLHGVAGALGAYMAEPLLRQLEERGLWRDPGVEGDSG